MTLRMYIGPEGYFITPLAKTLGFFTITIYLFYTLKVIHC